MEENKTIYCRFCVKPEQPLLLDLGTKEYEHIQSQLNKLALTVDFNSHLPKTICTECSDLLKRTYTFVEQIERSQIILNEVFSKESLQNIKIEIETHFEKSLDFTADENKTFKCEFDEDFYDVPIEDENEILCELNKCENNADDSKRKSPNEDGIEIESKSNSSLKKKISWNSYEWTCKYCKEEFKSMTDLRNHCKEIHGECNGFYCIDCERGFDKFKDFISDICGHRLHFKKMCPYCDVQIPKRMHMNQHTSIHNIPPNAPCISCGEMFTNPEELTQHQTQYKAWTIKSMKEYYLKCKICLKEFKSRSGCLLHKKIHDSNRKRDHICEICGKAFHEKFVLEQHKMTHSETKPHECKICSKTFISLVKLRAHVNIHTGTKPYTCEQCGRSFRLKDQMKKHSIIHTDEMPFQCTNCPKKFRFSSLLKIHERQHTGERPYSCEVCTIGFANWSNYNKHMVRKHKNSISKRKIIKVDKNADTEQWTNEIMTPLKRGKKSTDM